MSDNPTSLIAIKGRLHSPKDRYYGLFLLLINEETNLIESGSVVLSVYSELFQTELNHSWRAFENKINELKYRNQYAPLITQDLQDRLKNLMVREDFYEELMKSIRAEATKQLAKTFQVIFNRSIRDPDLEIEVALEWLKREDLEAPNPVEINPQEEPKNLSTDKSGVSLAVSLVLDPIRGKSVVDLKPKDQIMVRIIPMGERANYFIDLMQLRGEKNILPCAMTIESITPSPSGWIIRGKIDENLYGELTETENVMVQLAPQQKLENPAVKSTKNPEKISKPKEKISEKRPNRSIVILVSLSLLLLGVLVYLLVSL